MLLDPIKYLQGHYNYIQRRCSKTPHPAS